MRAKEIDFRIGVSQKFVDGHHSGYAVVIAHVADVPLEIDQARLQRVQVLSALVGNGHAVAELERPAVRTRFYDGDE